jgi:hypothetical protein
LNVRNSPSTENRPEQYCVLAYRASGSGFSTLGGDEPILLAHLSSDIGLSLFISSRWREIVAHEHLDYLRSLLEDFALREKSDPGGLFQQITSLEVGPLVTRHVGEWDSRDDRVKALEFEFEELK